MPVTTAFSTRPMPDAARDLRAQCKDEKPRVIFLFASPRYDLAALNREICNAYPGACVAGCSTAGEMIGGNMLNGSVVAIFLGEDVAEQASAAVVEDLSFGTCVRDALAHLERSFQARLSDLDLNTHVGIVLMDGLSGAQERVMEKLGDATDILFVGGSAGDDLSLKTTPVFANGRIYTDAAAVVLLRLKNGFDIVKTQSFKPTGKTLVATKVDEGLRQVIEFDHQPALDAYAAALKIPPEQASSQFFRHPLGLMIEGDPFVRSPQAVSGRCMRFYCHIKEGMELAVLEATDIVADTRAALESQQVTTSQARGVIEFQCILRTLQLREEGRCGQYGAIFSDIPMVGFSTYGEAYLGHINQTSTFLVFR